VTDRQTHDNSIYRASIASHGTNYRQTFAASNSWHTARLASNIEDNWPLDPRDDKMCTLTNCHLLYSSKSIKDHCSVTTIDCKQQLITMYLSILAQLNHIFFLMVLPTLSPCRVLLPARIAYHANTIWGKRTVFTRSAITPP